jgi:ABC-2 type transport system permease protein
MTAGEAQAPTAIARPRAASFWRMVLAQTAMELRLTLRRGENLLVTLLIPAGALLFFGSVGILPAAAGRRVDGLLAATTTMAIIATSLVSLGIVTGYDRHYGVLKRLGGSPLPRAALIAAKLLAVVVVEAVQLALLVGIAVVVLGWRPDQAASVAVLAAVVLGTIGFAGLGLAMAGALRAEATLALANALFLLFLLVGGALVPLDALPEPIARVAAVLPPGALSEALRAGFGATAASPAVPLVVLAVWAAVLAALAVRVFRWE